MHTISVNWYAAQTDSMLILPIGRNNEATLNADEVILVW